MNKTKISWTDFTSNPIRAIHNGKLGWYCTRVSDGCKNCYASTLNTGRFGNGLDYSAANRNKVAFVLAEKEFAAWRARRKPAKIFVEDMGDLFHEDIPDETIYAVFKGMSEAPQHTFQVLTKRIDRAAKLIPKIRGHLPDRLEHIWLGVSVENQDAADERIPLLLQIPATIRFLSCEPLLGPVDLDASEFWVIVGGESGPNRRPMDLDWVRYLRDQCVDVGAAFWFKQESALRPGTHPILDGVEWRQFPAGPG